MINNRVCFFFSLGCRSSFCSSSTWFS